MRLSVLPSRLVNDSIECLQIVKDSLSAIFSAPAENPSVYGFSYSYVRPRLPNAILLTIGGWSGRNPADSIEAYDVHADHWINVTNNLEHSRAYHGAAFLSGYVYCAGGADRMESFNSVCRFDLRTRTWQEVSPMHYCRCYVSVTVMNGCIYAVGGYNEYMRLSSAEYYQPENNQWTVIAHMHEPRSDASCTALHNKVGGFDGNSNLRSAEAYNTQTNTLHSVSSMVTPRSNFGIEIVSDRLFVVGGFNGFIITDNVEYDDALTDGWSEACDMEVFRSALSCCEVSGLPNMADYAAPHNALLPSLMEDEEEQSGDPV